MSYIFPVMIFFLTVSFAAALSLYWLVSGVVAFIQQDRLLKKDEEILGLDAKNADRANKAKEAVIVDYTPKNKQSKTSSTKKAKGKHKKRR